MSYFKIPILAGALAGMFIASSAAVANETFPVIDLENLCQEMLPQMPAHKCHEQELEAAWTAANILWDTASVHTKVVCTFEIVHGKDTYTNVKACLIRHLSSYAQS